MKYEIDDAAKSPKFDADQSEPKFADVIIFKKICCSIKNILKAEPAVVSEMIFLSCYRVNPHSKIPLMSFPVRVTGNHNPA